MSEINVSFNPKHNNYLCGACDSYFPSDCMDLSVWYVKHLSKKHSCKPSDDEKNLLRNFFQRDIPLIAPAPSIEAMYKQDPKVKPGYICSVEGCNHVTINKQNRVNKFKKHFAKCHADVPTDSMFSEECVEEIRPHSHVFLGPVGCTYTNQPIDEMVPFDPNVEQSLIPQAPLLPTQQELLANLPISNVGMSATSAWHKWSTETITSRVNQKLFEERADRDQVRQGVKDWYDNSLVYFAENIETQFGFRDSIMSHSGESFTGGKRFDPNTVSTKGLPLLVVFLSFLLNLLVLYELKTLPQCFNVFLLPIILPLFRFQMDPTYIEFLDNLLESVFSFAVDEMSSGPFNHILSIFLVTSLYGDGDQRIAINIRNLSGKAMAMAGMLRFHTLIRVVKSKDQNLFNRVRTNNKTPMYFVHMVYRDAIRYAQHPSLKSVNIAPVDENEIALMRSGTVWSFDHHRKVYKEMLERFVGIVEELSDGFDWCCEGDGVFNVSGEIVLIEHSFNATPGYGLSVGLDALRTASPMVYE